LEAFLRNAGCLPNAPSEEFLSASQVGESPHFRLRSLAPTLPSAALVFAAGALRVRPHPDCPRICARPRI
jgi:hypothetical protein